MKHKYYDARTWSQCPYCEHKNVSAFDMVQYPTDVFVTCNSEDGGCDKKYIIRVSWIAKAEVLSLKPEYYHQDFYAESKLFAETAYHEVT